MYILKFFFNIINYFKKQKKILIDDKKPDRYKNINSSSILI